MTFDLTAEEASGVATLTELLEDLVVPVGRRTGGLFLGGFFLAMVAGVGRRRDRRRWRRNERVRVVREKGLGAWCA